MQNTWQLAAALALTIAISSHALADSADNLAVQARALHEAANLETDPDKQLSLLRHAREALQRIATEDPADPYAKRLQTGEPILALTLAGIDKEIAAAEREKSKLTGTPGSYVALFDADRKPLYSAYWIAPNVISVADAEWSGERAPDARPTLVIDRYLLPRGVAALDNLWMGRISYAPLPDESDVPAPGHAFSTTAVVSPNGPEPASDESEATFTIDFAWKEPTGKSLAGMTLEGSVFTATNAFVLDLDAPTIVVRKDVTGVYVPALDFGFSQAVWDLARTALIGRDAMSSADFAVILKLADMRLSPAARQCLTDLRASADYKTYNDAWAGLERRTEKTISAGMTDTHANKDGGKPYRELDRKYGIAKRFKDCQLK